MYNFCMLKEINNAQKSYQTFLNDAKLKPIKIPSLSLSIKNLKFFSTIYQVPQKANPNQFHETINIRIYKYLIVSRSEVHDYWPSVSNFFLPNQIKYVL